MKLFDGGVDEGNGGEAQEFLGDDCAPGIDQLSLAESDWLLHVGLGAGNLTQSLLARLGAEGRVIGIDVCERAVAVAAANVNDARASFHVADACCLSLPDECIDVALCPSEWPHYDNPVAVAGEMLRVLRPGGTIYVWHWFSLQGRGDTRSDADASLLRERLTPAADTAALLLWVGFSKSLVYDKSNGFLVTASKERRSESYS